MSNNPIIKNLNISNYRRFKNFQGVPIDFSKYNILYGWNYSGKTTISRIFACFDGTLTDKSIDEGADFYLKTTLGDLDFSKRDKIKIHTFNSDYVRDNLFFERHYTSNIIIVSDKANDTVEHIKNLKQIRQELLKTHSAFCQQLSIYDKESNQKRSDYAKELDKIFTEKFTAKNIPSVENSLDKTNLEQYILDDNDKESKIKTLRNPTKFTQIKNIEKLSSIDIPKLISMLKKVVTPSSIIKELHEKNAEEWVKQGINLHKDVETCIFCGAKLDKEYLTQLDALFKSEYDILGVFLQEFEQRIDIYSGQIPSPASIIDNYKNDYTNIHKNLNDEIVKYNNKIKAIKKIIKAKYNNRNLYFRTQVDLDIGRINIIIESLNDVINKHNTFIINEENEKNKIKEVLKNCIIAELLTDPSYKSAIKNLNEAEIGKTNVEKQIKDVESQITVEEAKVSDVKKGAEEINKVLKRLFIGDSSITLRVEQTHNDKGELVDITKLYRNNEKPADNLSDGERTAIAFAHFYTKVQDSIKNSTSQNEILFIDDPISSLDKNHIYSISVMIKEIIDKFNQVFVTTHNYEFYRLLKRNSGNTTNYYYIKREGDISIIDELPKELKIYNSEYEYFFHQLYEFNKNNTNADIYTIGHCARRFLDNYLEYKIPNNCTPLDKLIKYVKTINEDKVKYAILYRILNDESHVHPEILFDKGYLIQAVKLILDTVENYDALHYETLIDSCNISL